MSSIHDLIMEMDSPVIQMDGDGNVVAITEAFTKEWGWKSEELVGKPLTAIIPEELRDAHHMGFSKYLNTGQPTLLGQPLDLALVTPDGEQVVALHFILAGEVDGAPRFAARITPR